MYCQLEHSMVAAGESMPIKAGVVGCCLIIYVTLYTTVCISVVRRVVFILCRVSNMVYVCLGVFWRTYVRKSAKYLVVKLYKQYII